MNVDPEEIRRKARTARENSYNASQSEADLTKQKEVLLCKREIIS